MQELDFYRQMYLIRRFEEKLLELFSRGLLNGTVHTCIGQEAVAVGVINALDKDIDIVFSNHRGHGHFIAFTGDVEGLLAEIMGKKMGVCGGVGGTQHLHKGNFYSNGIQGGIVPVATGMALAEKILNANSIVCVFLGDGTLGQGVVYESFNIASKWSLPILFVVENNQYAQSTHYKLVHAGSLEKRAEPFGIESKYLKADDVIKVYDLSKECIEVIRRERRPVFLYFETYRLGPHSKGDDLRSKEEIEFYRQKDPLRKLAESIKADIKSKIEQEIDELLATTIERVMKLPRPDFWEYRKEMLKKGIYAL
jgi:TPP-dependent pyruvate/acetoin dehydrogenase alpha subunit